MADPTLLATVIRILAEQTQFAGPITGQSALEDDLGLTSLGVTQVLIRLEDELGSSLDDAVVMSARLRTVDDLLALVRRDVRTAL